MLDVDEFKPKIINNKNYKKKRNYIDSHDEDNELKKFLNSLNLNIMNKKDN